MHTINILQTIPCDSPIHKADHQSGDSNHVDMLHILIRLGVVLLLLLGYTSVGRAQIPDGSSESESSVADSICFTESTGTLADMVSATVIMKPGYDDSASTILNIGFTFQLYSTDYTQFSVSSNGLMELGATRVTATGHTTNTSVTYPLLSPFWDDISTAGAGIRYKVSGVSPNRTLVVEWQAYKDSVGFTYTGTPHYTFQVQLHEGSNKFEYVYGSMDSTRNSSGVIGWAAITLPSGDEKSFSITPGHPTIVSRTTADTNVNLCAACGYVAIASGTSYNFDPDCVPPNNNTGATWTRLQLGATIDLSGAWFISALEGFVVGTGGRMYRTIDGGVTWTLVVTGTTVDLTGIRVIGGYWYIYGHGGLVRYSTNGGVTWITVTLNTTETIYSISFVNAHYGFAVGSGGTIFLWNGISWIRQTINVSITFYSVYVVGNYAYAVGAGGIIYRYNGSTWVRVNISITTVINDIQFFDDGFGYFVGAGGVICRTVDGGITWTVLITNTTLNIRSIRIVSRTIAFAVGDGGLLLQTTDGGLTWVRIDLGTTVNLTSVTFVDGVGYAFGGGGISFTFRSSFVTIYAGTSYNRLFLNTSVRLNRTVFISRMVGYVVGNGGTLMRTTNGGSTWITINIGVTIDLTSIRVIGGVIYITGSGGYIGYSIDGGITWLRYTINTTATFHNIHFFNKNYGCAVGSAGAIWLFNGTVWTRQTINSTAIFYSVYGLGKYIYACGSGGALWRYDGANWTRINIGITINLYDIHFYDGRFGYVVGDGGKLYRTIDGGLTWRLQVTGITANIRSIRFASRLIAWASCDGGIVLQTVDGGVNWTAVSLGAQYDLTSLYYADGAGYIVGTDGIAYSFITTQLRFAAGLHFTRLNSGTTREIRGASFLDRYIGFIAGRGGLLCSTLDGGLTWNNLQLTTTVNLNSIRMIGNVGFVVGDSGHICRTLDSGATWQKFDLGSTANIHAISMLNASYGFAVGSGGSIFRFNGSAWVRENISITKSFYAVYTIGDVCYAVGQGGIIHRWDGTAWIALSSGVNVDIYDVAFYDANFGYFVGADGTLCRTIDGGTNWQRIAIGITANIRSIKAHSREIAWAVCDGGTVLQTLDGGLTWASISIGTDDILSIDFIDGTGWVFGASGLAYSFTSDNVRSGSFTYNRLNRALCFNGSSSWVDLSNGENFQPDSDISLSAWIHPSAFADTAGIIGNYRRQGAAGSGYGLLIKSDGRIGLAIAKVNGITDWVWSDSAVAIDKWTHIAGTFDGTTMKVYLDGREAGSFTNTMMEIQIVLDNTMAIGRYFRNGRGYFNGCIDEVALWSVACPADHIRKMMHLRLAGNEKGLVSCWHLDDTDGEFCRDAVSGIAGVTIDVVRNISTVRIGIGRSWVWNITGNGRRYFNGTDLTIDFTNTVGIHDILVSSVLDIQGIDLPAGIGRVMPRWWTIRGYGSGTFAASLTFYLGPNSIGAIDSATPGNLRLFCRGANGGGAWTQVGTVTRIDRRTGEVTFGGVTGGNGTTGIGRDYGEFIIGTTGDSDFDPASDAAIVENPFASTVCIGDSALLGVIPRGGNMKYQWRRNGVDIVGANERILLIPQVTVSDNGGYDVVVTAQTGQEVRSEVAELFVDSLPVITQQPVGASVSRGDSVSFTVQATGTGVTFQWRHNGEIIVGETSATITLLSVQPGDTGSYSVIIISQCGDSSVSDSAMLQLKPTLSVPGSSLIAIGASMSVSPHPAHGIARIRITLPDGVVADAQSTLALYDLQGNRVMDLSTGFAQGDFTTVEINTDFLANGLYQCRLDTRRWSGWLGSFVVAK